MNWGFLGKHSSGSEELCSADGLRTDAGEQRGGDGVGVLHQGCSLPGLLMWFRGAGSVGDAHFAGRATSIFWVTPMQIRTRLRD